MNKKVMLVEVQPPAEDKEKQKKHTQKNTHKTCMTFLISGGLTWLGPSSGARSAYRASCSAPGKTHRPGGKHNQPFLHVHSPSDPSSAPGGTLVSL